MRLPCRETRQMIPCGKYSRHQGQSISRHSIRPPLSFSSLDAPITALKNAGNSQADKLIVPSMVAFHPECPASVQKDPFADQQGFPGVDGFRHAYRTSTPSDVISFVQDQRRSPANRNATFLGNPLNYPPFGGEQSDAITISSPDRMIFLEFNDGCRYFWCFDFISDERSGVAHPRRLPYPLNPCR